MATLYLRFYPLKKLYFYPMSYGTQVLPVLFYELGKIFFYEIEISVYDFHVLFVAS